MTADNTVLVEFATCSGLAFRHSSLAVRHCRDSNWKAVSSLQATARQTFHSHAISAITYSTPRWRIQAAR